MSLFSNRVSSRPIAWRFASLLVSPPLHLALWICLTGFAPGIHGEPRPGLERRPNTSLAIPETPPASEFTTERAFGSLRFTDPVGMTTPPGETNRLFVLEQAGRISVITNLVSPTRTVFMDIDCLASHFTPDTQPTGIFMSFTPRRVSTGCRAFKPPRTIRRSECRTPKWC
jgi:hypothetical protein